MRRYNILQPFWLSFFSKALYRDVRQHWHGIIFAYLLLMVAICYLPFAYRLNDYIWHVTNNLQPWFIQLPTITIKNHEVSIDKPVPYFINDPANGQIIAIIDPTGTINTLTKTDTAKILLTKQQLFIKKSENSIKIFQLDKLRDNVYETTDIIAVVKKIGLSLIFFIYPIMILFYFILGILEALIYAALAKLFIRTFLTYHELFRLALMAITPKFILLSLLGLFAIPLPYKGIISFALGMAYLVYAIEANKKALAIAQQGRQEET